MNTEICASANETQRAEITDHLKKVNCEIGFNVDVNKYQTYLKSAGTVACLIINRARDIENSWETIFNCVNTLGLPSLLIAQGTNQYFTNETHQVALIIDETPPRLSNSGNNAHEVTFSSGYPLNKAIGRLAPFGIDLSLFSGIPGTVGAGVVNNVGISATGENIGNHVKSITIFNRKSHSSFRIEPANDPNFFSNRNSRIKVANANELAQVVTDVTFTDKGAAGDYDRIKAKIKKQLIARRPKNLDAEHTSGSFFANGSIPIETQKELRRLFPQIQAQKILVRHILQQSGLTQASLCVNGAHFTNEFAFLKTTPQTTDRDVAQLLEVTLDRLGKYGVSPMQEVQIIGKSGWIDLETFIREYH